MKALRWMGWSVMTLGLAFSTGCAGAADDGAGEKSAPDEGLEGEAVGTASESLVDAAFAVGVIPIGNGTVESSRLIGTTCPSGSDLVQIYMDDEDSNNQTAWGTWRASNDPNPDFGFGFYGWNTMLRYCRVDGRQFRPLTTNASDKSRFYAVLKLGSTCPNGSIEFTRYFDNEDSDNENRASGPLWPNVANSNTTLKFCFFGAGAPTMASFPMIGAPYAVYHDFQGAQPAPFNQGKGIHVTDDEDNDNENRLTPTGTTAYYDFTAIISAGRNTTFELGRVR